MKADIYQNGEQVATVRDDPFQWEYEGDDERLLSAFRSAEELTDTQPRERPGTEGNVTSPPETDVDATDEQRFIHAVTLAEDLGYWVWR